MITFTRFGFFGLTPLAVGETYWVNNLAATHGFVRPFMILLGLEVGLALIGIALFAYFGKRMRQFTKNAAVHSF